MKKSKKIIYGLILILFVGIGYNGFILKKKFDEIDKTDEYWDYPVQKKLNFSHIKIEGGTKTYVNITPGTKNKLYYKSKIEANFKYSVTNDTLLLKFSPNLYSSKVNQRRIRKYKILITYKDLKSLSLNDSYLDFDIETMDDIKIKAKGFTTLKIDNNEAKLDTLMMNISENAYVTFRNTKNPVEINFLKAKLTHNSFADFTSIKAKTFLPEIHGESKIGIGSGIILPKIKNY